MSEPIPFMLAPESVDLIVDGLSELPYKRVANFIAGISNHVRMVQEQRAVDAAARAQAEHAPAQPEVRPAPRRLKKTRRA